MPEMGRRLRDQSNAMFWGQGKLVENYRRVRAMCMSYAALARSGTERQNYKLLLLQNPFDLDGFGCHELSGLQRLFVLARAYCCLTCVFCYPKRFPALLRDGRRLLQAFPYPTKSAPEMEKEEREIEVHLRPCMSHAAHNRSPATLQEN